jgi:phosphopantothenoylcysteine decarboxylase / phosphopantothenate---cysteine ligase
VTTVELPRAERSLLLCVSGSIAATDAVALLQLLVERRAFAEIRVALSESAQRFVRQEPFAVLSRQPCITNIFDEAQAGRAVHVEVARQCDIAVVAPASGDLIAKLAHGIADDTITNMLSVFDGEQILVPAVHPATRRRPSFERNLARVRDDGFLICGPVEGYSRSEDRRGPDVAAMPGPETIAAFVEYVAMTGSAPDVMFPHPADGQPTGRPTAVP